MSCSPTCACAPSPTRRTRSARRTRKRREESADDWAERARRRAAGNREATFFAYLGDDAVGMVGGFVHDGAPPVDLISMWVAPEARRHGAARALIEAVVDWARDAGHDELQLWVTEVNTAHARSTKRPASSPRATSITCAPTRRSPSGA